MALTNNPNKTKSIEKKWKNEVRRRFSDLDSEMRQIPISSGVVNISDAERIEIDNFMREFERLATALILAEPWQNKYQTLAYERSVKRTNEQIKSLFTDGTAQALGLLHAESSVSMALPSNVNELNFLHERANDKLSKWVAALLEDTKSILHENLGIVPVDSIYEAIADRINVTTSRADVIAATEIAQASQRAVIKQSQEMSIALDEEVEVRWITVRDSRVRHLHASWHGKLMSPEQGARNITISPWNCRCGLKPVRSDSVSARENAKYKSERKLLLSQESSNLDK